MIKSGIKKMGLFIAFGAILGGVSAQNSTGDTKEVQSEYAVLKLSVSVDMVRFWLISWTME